MTREQRAIYKALTNCLVAKMYVKKKIIKMKFSKASASWTS